jgi:hypothetical protein
LLQTLAGAPTARATDGPMDNILGGGHLSSSGRGGHPFRSTQEGRDAEGLDHFDRRGKREAPQDTAAVAAPAGLTTRDNRPGRTQTGRCFPKPGFVRPAIKREGGRPALQT